GFALQFEGISPGVQRRYFGLRNRRNLTSRLRRMRPIVPRLRINGRAEQHDYARGEKVCHGDTLAEFLKFYCYSAYTPRICKHAKLCGTSRHPPRNARVQCRYAIPWKRTTRPEGKNPDSCRDIGRGGLPEGPGRKAEAGQHQAG